MSTGAPRARNVAIWPAMRACSSSSGRDRSSPEYQPEISASSCLSRMGPRILGSMGNLTPVSVPENPASRLSFKQVSRLVSPPSWGRSLLVQAMGATPSRIFIAPSDSQALLALRGAVLCRRLLHALAARHLGHAHV